MNHGLPWRSAGASDVVHPKSTRQWHFPGLSNPMCVKRARTLGEHTGTTLQTLHVPLPLPAGPIVLDLPIERFRDLAPHPLGHVLVEPFELGLAGRGSLGRVVVGQVVDDGRLLAHVGAHSEYRVVAGIVRPRTVRGAGRPRRPVGRYCAFARRRWAPRSCVRSRPPPLRLLHCIAPVRFTRRAGLMGRRRFCVPSGAGDSASRVTSIWSSPGAGPRS